MEDQREKTKDERVFEGLLEMLPKLEKNAAEIKGHYYVDEEKGVTVLMSDVKAGIPEDGVLGTYMLLRSALWIMDETDVELTKSRLIEEDSRDLENLLKFVDESLHSLCCTLVVEIWRDDEMLKRWISPKVFPFHIDMTGQLDFAYTLLGANGQFLRACFTDQQMNYPVEAS